MGKVYLCFKWSFIVFDVLFGVDNRVSRGVMCADTTGMLTMAITAMGVFGAYKEKNWPLIAFFLAMTAVVVLFLWAGISFIPLSSETKDRLEVYFRNTTPLDKASSESTTAANKFQYLPCAPIILEYLDKAFVVFTGALFGVVAVAAIGMVTAMTLCCKIRKRGVERGSASFWDSEKSQVPLHTKAFPLTHVNVPQAF